MFLIVREWQGGKQNSRQNNAQLASPEVIEETSWSGSFRAAARDLALKSQQGDFIVVAALRIWLMWLFCSLCGPRCDSVLADRRDTLRRMIAGWSARVTKSEAFQNETLSTILSRSGSGLRRVAMPSSRVYDSDQSLRRIRHLWLFEIALDNEVPIDETEDSPARRGSASSAGRPSDAVCVNGDG